MGTVGGALSLAGPVFGTKLKAEARRYYGSFVNLHARGEMIPNEKSYCELDPARKDRWGIPVLRFHFEWSEAELAQVVHQQKTFASVIEAAGGIPDSPASDPRKVMTAGGSVNHELGVTRMSARAEDGVTDPTGRLWDCPNVLVADGATFVSGPYKNPTLTIMALAWRGCDQLLAGTKNGSISAPA